MIAGEGRRAERCEGERGAVVVEFALVSLLLLTIVFAIINFGLILSFHQDVTRAAAEGARAGAVAFPNTIAWRQAMDATDQAVRGFGQACGAGGMDCYVNIHSCAAPVPPGTPSNARSTGDCVTVELVYDYSGYPLLARVPLISAFLPDTIRATSVARLNP